MNDVHRVLQEALEAARDPRRLGEVLPDLLVAIESRQDDLGTHERGILWHLRGILAWRRDDDVPLAAHAFQRSLELLEAADAPEGAAYAGRVFDTLGQMLQHQGLLEDARRELEEALARKVAARDEEGVALTHGSLGRLCLELGDFRAAGNHFQEDLAYVVQHTPNEGRLRGQLLTQLGSCRIETGETDEARRLLEESAALAREREDDFGLAFAAVYLARLALATGRVDEAEDRADDVRSLLARLDTAPPELRALAGQLDAEVAVRRGDPTAALVRFAAAGQAFDDAPRISPVERARFLETWAGASLDEGQTRHAADLLREALRRLDATTAEPFRLRLGARLRVIDESAWLHHNTGRFVGHGQIELLLSEAGQAGFRGRAEEVTVLFSDLRGFTSFSERLDPEVLVTFLNRYLGAMTRCVEHFGGMVDKFIGDAVMALFSLPKPHEDDADRAVAAALYMQTELERFNRTLPGDLPHLEAGVGLHHGAVTAGLIGSPQKRSYTVIGDAVNTASRLEGMTKLLGVPLLATRAVVARLQDPTRWLLLPLGRYRPKGRRGGVDAFSVMGRRVGRGTAREADRQIEATAEALARFETREFPAAEGAFRALAERHAHGVGSRAYERLAAEAAQLKEAPPPEDWDGAVVLTEK